MHGRLPRRPNTVEPIRSLRQTTAVRRANHRGGGVRSENSQNAELSERASTHDPRTWTGSRGAGNGTRTRDIKLGKLALYQLSYARRWSKLPHASGSGQGTAHRTDDYPSTLGGARTRGHSSTVVDVTEKAQ